jgi:NACHT domain
MTEPGPFRLVLARFLTGAGAPLQGLSQAIRRRRLAPGGMGRPRRWRARPPMRVLAWSTGTLAVIFILWLLRSAFVLTRGKPLPFPFDPDGRCESIGVSCAALSGFVTPFLSLALASVAFLLWRLRSVQRPYTANARKRPGELVPGAEAVAGSIIGRDELCHVLMENLRDQGTCRPRVIVGGVGTGKTAVLVRLTQLLARSGAIPVPIGLRDAQRRLDFADLARERFIDEVDSHLLSGAEGEKIWRRLLRDGRVVVLADGLEEALAHNDLAHERDNLIRLAIRHAHLQRVPLVVASRPHAPLRDTDAAVCELEPLSEDAALTYVEGGESAEDERRLDWIVETADVTEAPLYLRITRELYRAGRLRHVAPGQDSVLDTRSNDRCTLRLALLRTWEHALVQGYLRPEIPLNPAERQACVEILSGLACGGLGRDRPDVAFDDPQDEEIAKEVRSRLDAVEAEPEGKLRRPDIDVRVAAAWGRQLGLVEPEGKGVRFRDGLMQAYLGSRLMEAMLRDHERRCARAALGFVGGGEEPCPPGGEEPCAPGCDESCPHGGRAPCPRGDLALLRPGPGMLFALVLYSRRASASSTTRTAPTPPDQIPPALTQTRHISTLLLEAAAEHSGNTALDIYAAALEIDCVSAAPQQATIAAEIRSRWRQMRAGDPRVLLQGKLRLVLRFGEALRTLDARRAKGECAARSAYPQLYATSCMEASYSIRLAAAHEVGAGGSAAYAELEQLLEPPCAGCGGRRARRQAGKDATVRHDTHPLGEHQAEDDTHRARLLSAWLAPLFVGSVGSIAAAGAPGQTARPHTLAAWARDDLAQWLAHAGLDEHQDLTLAEEIALAQGFKYAANRRGGHKHSRPEDRAYLAEQALQLLRGARYWFSQLTLVQALCLWSLPDGNERPPLAGGRRGAKPMATVEHWLEIAGSRRRGDRPAGISVAPAPVHPFVAQAADLAVLALETGQPERYCWIDESRVVCQVGSQARRPPGERKHQLWIPLSAGWSALSPRAQQLVADVLLLLNLAERGDRPAVIEHRLERANRPDLPPCLTRDRAPLSPGAAAGLAGTAEPGTGCTDGCPFGLCPYPPQGSQPLRAELSEQFCRWQHALLSGPPIQRRTAPWQGISAARMRRFWTDMAERSRATHRQPEPG